MKRWQLMAVLDDTWILGILLEYSEKFQGRKHWTQHLHISETEVHAALWAASNRDAGDIDILFYVKTLRPRIYTFLRSSQTVSANNFEPEMTILGNPIPTSLWYMNLAGKRMRWKALQWLPRGDEEVFAPASDIVTYSGHISHIVSFFCRFFVGVINIIESPLQSAGPNHSVDVMLKFLSVAGAKGPAMTPWIVLLATGVKPASDAYRVYPATWRISALRRPGAWEGECQSPTDQRQMERVDGKLVVVWMEPQMEQQKCVASWKRQNIITFSRYQHRSIERPAMSWHSDL